MDLRVIPAIEQLRQRDAMRALEIRYGRAALLDALRAETAALRERTVLLILDNAEHLRDACADVAIALLAACPQVRLLATSRAPLHVLGEQTWRVSIGRTRRR